jgi:hypothetical protein
VNREIRQLHRLLIASWALFLVLHLIRLPLVLMARALEVSMRFVDAYATRQASQYPTHPINRYKEASA